MLERLRILVDGNAQGAIREFEKLGAAADRELGKTDDRLQKLSAGLTNFGAGAVAGGAVAIGGLKMLADSASAYGEQVSAATVTFGEKGAAQLEKFAEAAADTANISKTEATKAANGFASFARQAGLTGTAATKFSTDLVQLAGDISSFRDISVEEALQALQSGLAGEGEPIRRLGGDISDVALKAEYLALTGQEVTGSLTQQQKVVAINSKLFKDFELAQGDVLRTQDSLANQTRNAAANFENLKTELGEGLVPVFATVVGGVNDIITKFGELPAGLKGPLGTLAGVGAFGSVAVGALSLVAGQAIKFRDAFTTTTTTVVDGVETQKRSLNNLGRAAGLAAGAVALIGVGFTLDALIKGSGDAQQSIDRFKAAVDFKPQIEQLNALGTSAEGLLDKLNPLENVDKLLFFDAGDGERSVASLNAVDRALGDFYKQGNLPEVQKGIDALQRALDLRAPDVNAQTIRNAQGIIDDYRSKLEDANAAADSGTDSFKFFGIELGNFGGAAQGAAGNIAGTTEEIDKNKEAAELTETAFANLDAQLSLISASYEGLEARAGAFGEALERSTVADDQIASASALGAAYNDTKKVLGDLPAEIDLARLALGGYNEEQQKAINGLLSLGDQSQNYLTSLLEQNKSNEEVRFSAAVLRDEYVRQFEQLGFNREQIADYLEVLGLTPQQVETAIVLSDQEVAMAKIEAYQSLIAATPPEKLTNYIAAISQGDFIAAAGELDKLAAERIAPVVPKVDPAAQQTAISQLNAVVTEAQNALDVSNAVFAAAETARVAQSVIAQYSNEQVSTLGRLERDLGIDLNFNGVVGRRFGGPVSSGRPYMVGEVGPELFVPNSSGKIVPNDKLGGNTLNLTQNIQSSDPILTAAEVVRRQRDAEFLAGV